MLADDLRAWANSDAELSDRRRELLLHAAHVLGHPHDPYMERIEEWHRHIDQDVAAQPTTAFGSPHDWHLDGLRSELRELSDAIEMTPAGVEVNGATRSHHATWVGTQAHELADVLYVAFGMARRYGWPILPMFKAVHSANMTKLPKLTDESGKVIKGPSYVAPDARRVILENLR